MFYDTVSSKEVAGGFGDIRHLPCYMRSNSQLAFPFGLFLFNFFEQEEMLSLKVISFFSVCCMLLLLQCEGRFLERPSSQVLPRYVQNRSGFRMALADYSFRELDFGLEKSEDIPEECFPFCTPGACSASSCGVSESNLLEGVELASNMTDEDLIPRLLAKRNIFGPTQNGITQYLMDQSKKSSINTIGPEFIGIYEYPSYCLQTSFAAAPLTEDQYLAGTAKIRLTGCTALVVVSARGVYMVREDFSVFKILEICSLDNDISVSFLGGPSLSSLVARKNPPRLYLFSNSQYDSWRGRYHICRWASA